MPHALRHDVAATAVLALISGDETVVIRGEVGTGPAFAYHDDMIGRLEQRLQGISRVPNTALALGLAALVCLQVWALWRWDPGAGATPRAGGYLLAIGAFLPLLLRRRHPLLCLLPALACALAYILLDYPPAFVIAGPMIALYSLALYSKRLVPALLLAAALGLVAATFAVALSPDRWVAKAGGSCALLAAAAFMGGVQRSRRAYTREVEERAAEAERTREEEGRRRAQDERLRIAREVHDVVAHSLSVCVIQANAGLQALDDRGPGTQQADMPVASALRAIVDTSRRALADLRTTLKALRTDDGAAPLAPAHDLRSLEVVLQPARAAGLQVSLLAPEGLDQVPDALSRCAYRIIQEAVTNVLRHATAATLQVVLVSDGGHMTITVADDGQGSSRRPLVEGGGIRGMRERAAALGGWCTSGPLPGGGYQVLASLPLTESGR